MYVVSDVKFEVQDGHKNGRVDLQSRTCTCMQWHLSDLSCGHLIEVTRLFGHRDCNQLATTWFTMHVYRLTYDEQVNPLPDPSEYVLPDERMTVLPPPMNIRNIGRPCNYERIPS